MILFRKKPAKIEGFTVTLKCKGCQDEFISIGAWKRLFRSCYKNGLIKDEQMNLGRNGQMNLSFNNLNLNQVNTLTKIAANDPEIARFQLSIDTAKLKKGDFHGGKVVSADELVETIYRNSIFQKIF